MKTRTNWTLFIVTTSGRKVPHWTDSTRAKCRAVRAGMSIPAGVGTIIERSE